MQMQPSDLADRYTILKVKKEKGLPVDEELEIYKKEIEFISKPLLAKLYAVNKEMWELEDTISGFIFASDIGKAYRLLRESTLIRNKIKNKITEKYGGFAELKKY